MLAEMKHATNKVLIWSNEKIFTVEGFTNRQNERFYAHNAGDLPKDSRSYLHHQKPGLIMVWATVASDGSKSPLILIDAGIKVNSEVYTEMLNEKVLLWVTETFGDHYTFTQDGALAHISNLTQRRCKEHFSSFGVKLIWPPSNQDINPMDFATWSILERNVSACSYSNVSDLKKVLQSSWVMLDEEMVWRSHATQ
ncbi:uncharacterized protein LOC106881793 [Octopus bimaculoides]|uniref:uncharacterized protein LOC106881793 n=1 Tax=Octopus bimaculoides TaxID=37653 RepID=UPI00071D15C0|nr:uncharacterized protein LOC106881793 [Octopus bimaculoides]|eukprot:XP_014787787.1 PREDICTED: uncharacterized protein LOC106881793 [Octopus bimaculoides]